VIVALENQKSVLEKSLKVLQFNLTVSAQTLKKKKKKAFN